MDHTWPNRNGGFGPVSLPLFHACLGTVHFETSCNEVAQRRFDRAMRYQHSYWYLPAKEIFDEVLKADPTCAIAH